MTFGASTAVKEKEKQCVLISFRKITAKPFYGRLRSPNICPKNSQLRTV